MNNLYIIIFILVVSSVIYFIIYKISTKKPSNVSNNCQMTCSIADSSDLSYTIELAKPTGSQLFYNNNKLIITNNTGCEVSLGCYNIIFNSKKNVIISYLPPPYNILPKTTKYNIPYTFNIASTSYGPYIKANQTYTILFNTNYDTSSTMNGIKSSDIIVTFTQNSTHKF